MKAKKQPKKKGTYVDGIAASEHLDSAGERIQIKGIDISSLTIDGVLNFEHKSDQSSQIVGKIILAKKIFKASDCETDRQRYFWDKIKTPYLYIIGELFDAVEHQGAMDVAAMLRYDEAHKEDEEVKKLINFSIEGQKLEKRGSIIKKCIARKISVTVTPCNKVCEAEEFKDTKSLEKSDKFSIVQDLVSMTKTETSSCQILKAEGYTPKRTFTTQTAPDNIRSGDRVVNTKPRAKTGVEIYGKPPKFSTDGRKIGEGSAPKPKKPNNVTTLNPPKHASKVRPYGITKNNKRKAIVDNLNKALSAGSMVGAPGAMTGNAALVKEDLSNNMHTLCEPKIDLMKKPKKKKTNITIPAKKMVEEHKKLVDVLESPSHKDDKKEAKKQKKELKEYKTKMKKKEFQGKNKRPGTFFPDSVEKSEIPEIISFIENKYPKMSKKEQISLAKTVVVMRRSKGE